MNWIKNKLAKWILNWVGIKKVAFDDETYEIELHLNTGAIMVAKGDEREWAASNLLEEMGFAVEERQ